MTDIRRTVLWVVFTMSLVLLWDGWQKHNGHPSMFAPQPKPVAAAPGSATSAVPSVSAPGAVPAAAVPAAADLALQELACHRTPGMPLGHDDSQPAAGRRARGVSVHSIVGSLCGTC